MTAKADLLKQLVIAWYGVLEKKKTKNSQKGR